MLPTCTEDKFDAIAEASLTVSVHSLNVHLEYAHNLTLDGDQFLSFHDWAKSTIGPNVGACWDGDDFAWDSGIDSLAAKLEALYATDGRDFQRGNCAGCGVRLRGAAMTRAITKIGDRYVFTDEAEWPIWAQRFVPIQDRPKGDK